MKRKRSHSRTRRPANGPRYKRAPMRRSRVVNPRSITHLHHRWAIPSTFSKVTQLGSMNYNGTLSSWNATTGIFSTATVGGPLANEMSAAMSFALKDLPDYTEFTNLYDQFRIQVAAVKVSIKMVNVPESTNQAFQAVANTVTNIYPTIWS